MYPCAVDHPVDEPAAPATAPPPPGAPEHRLAYQPALDGIRALSVLAVIAYHYGYRWAKGGFLGVDAFFVLSGYLITTLLVLEYRRGRGIGLIAFWGRRARRLLPALFLVLIFVALYTHHYVVPWERAGIRNDGIASLFYAANWRFVIDQQSYFTLFSAASPLRHTWSLAIEEQFYIVWPLIVLGCLRLARGSTRLLAGVCTAGALVSIFLMATLYQVGDPSRAYYGTDTHAHTLLIGALLALVLLAWTPSPRWRSVVMVLGPLALVAMFLAWWRVSDVASLYYHGGSAVFAIVVALVISASMTGGPARAALGFGPLPWIGRLSYGLYLWHWPIIVWIVPTRLHVGNTTLNVVRLALTFAVAIASYYVVELPIRQGWRKRTRRRAIVWLAPIGIAVTIVAIMASTAGATPPPNYLWASGDPLFCGPPRPQDARASACRAAPPRPAAPPEAGQAPADPAHRRLDRVQPLDRPQPGRPGERRRGRPGLGVRLWHRERRDHDHAQRADHPPFRALSRDGGPHAASVARAGPTGSGALDEHLGEVRHHPGRQDPRERHARRRPRHAVPDG